MTFRSWPQESIEKLLAILEELETKEATPCS